jgi:hypothetical protein
MQKPREVKAPPLSKAEKALKELIEKSLKVCNKDIDLIEFRREHAMTWSEMPARWVEILDDEYEDRLNALAALEAA